MEENESAYTLAPLNITLDNKTGETPEGIEVKLPVGGQVWFSDDLLAANQSVTTPWIATDHYPSLKYNLQSDQPGTIQIEYSQNGSTTKFTPASRQYTTNPSLFQAGLDPKLKYVRIKYTNGSTAQTTFGFEIRLNDSLVQPSASSLNAELTGSNLAQVSASVLFGPSGNNLYTPLDLTSALGAIASLANQTNGNQSTKIVNGNNQTLGIASSPVRTDPTGTTTQPVSGTVAVSSMPALTGSFTQAQPNNSTVASVTTTTQGATVLAANTNRKGAMFFSVSGTILIKLGTGASASSFTSRIVTNGYYELPAPVYTGPISAQGAGTLNVTEVF